MLAAMGIGNIIIYIFKIYKRLILGAYFLRSLSVTVI